MSKTPLFRTSKIARVLEVDQVDLGSGDPGPPSYQIVEGFQKVNFLSLLWGYDHDMDHYCIYIYYDYIIVYDYCTILLL